jgi:hypothetical protein
MRHPLPISSSQSQEATAGGSRLVNAYAEAAPQPGGKSPVVTRSAPGVQTFADVGVGPGRGMHVADGIVYVASGNLLYTVAEDQTVGIVGQLIGTDRVSFADNGAGQVMMIAGGKGWVLEDGTLTQIIDPDFPSPSVVDHLDGYMLVAEANSGKFFASKLLDATDYEALDFATAEAAPDDIVALRVNHRQVVLFGETTTELWYNSGGAGFPFERIAGGVLEIGCAAPFGIAEQDNTLFWLANDRTIRRLNGQTPVKVSNTTVDEALRAYTSVADCAAFPFAFRGHLCVAFQFPSAQACWVFDSATSEWHERASYDYSGWRVIDAVEAHGRTYVQDVLTGKVGILSPSLRTEWGAPIVDRRRFARLYAEGRRLTNLGLEIMAEAGVGAVSGQGTDPELRLWVSRDGGHTGQFAPSRSLGRRGRFGQRLTWPRLGSGDDVVLETWFSEPVSLTMTDAQVSYEVSR